MTLDELRLSIDKTAQNVVELLFKSGAVLASAESCTGGLISAAVTSVSGSSEVFDMGICTYANSAKIKYLGVKEETLEKFGAVSTETALEMAEGVAVAAKSDIGISTTGIAGPSGGTPEKPVGTVYVGLCMNGICEARLVFTDTKDIAQSEKREYIRLSTVLYALKWAEDTVTANMKKEQT